MFTLGRCRIEKLGWNPREASVVWRLLLSCMVGTWVFNLLFFVLHALCVSLLFCMYYTLHFRNEAHLYGTVLLFSNTYLHCDLVKVFRAVLWWINNPSNHTMLKFLGGAEQNNWSNKKLLSRTSYSFCLNWAAFLKATRILEKQRKWSDP